jgi:FlaA1/EpsC-like NDP-sugar epimerase
VSSALQRPASIAVQLALVVVSNRLAFLLRFDGDLPAFASEAFWAALPWLVAVRAAVFMAFRLQDGMWRYASIYDVRTIASAVAASSLGFYLATFLPFGPPVYPLSLFIVDAVTLMLLLSGVRLARRLLTEAHGRSGKRILIVGAGDAGELIVRDMKTSRH